MRAVLAWAIAMSSAVIGAVAGRSRRPHGRFSVWRVIAISVVAVFVAEGGTILWVGAPGSVLQPVIGGLGLGFVAGFFSGRKPPPPDQLPPNRSHR